MTSFFYHLDQTMESVCLLSVPRETDLLEKRDFVFYICTKQF